MNTLQAGFSRVDVTPMLGIAMRGYLIPRFAEGVRDPLQITTLALSCGEQKVVLMSMDCCATKAVNADVLRAHTAKETGLPVDAIWLHTTHTHTGPDLTMETDDPLRLEYFAFVKRKCADAAKLALADLKPAKMGMGTGKAPNVAFVRRFLMKDGSVATNPGMGNPNIDKPMGVVDERVHVLRFVREGGKNITLVNFGNHPDTIGTSLISADWPGFLRRTVEQSIPDTLCIFFNGAQGDVNHVNVFAQDGDLNDLQNDFDDVVRGYGHARYIGRVVTGAVLQIYDKVTFMDVDTIRFGSKNIDLKANKAKTDEELEEAHRICALHEEGRDDELPCKGMMLTTVLAKAARMVRLENAPDTIPMKIYAVQIGETALVGIPGEPFTGIGVRIKETEGWKIVLPCCLTNGAEAYFPMKEDFEYGGYETGISTFTSGVAEQIIKESRALLEEIRE